MPSPREWSLVVCGGGSGGHLIPALAVIEELRRHDFPPHRIIFLTSQREIESRILSRENVEVISLQTSSMVELKRRPWKLATSIGQARREFRGLTNPVAVGTGGLASVPGILAAKSCRIPIVLLEQNIIMGRANAWLSPLADVVCTSFENTKSGRYLRSKLRQTGNPVRRDIAHLATAEISSNDKRTLLILGGSQSSRAVSRAAVESITAISRLLGEWKIVHQSPESDCESVRDAYQMNGLTCEVAPFFGDLPAIYSRTGLVISRAGATSLAEFACAGIPAILIPYPNSVRDHQLLNAKYFETGGGAVVVEETDALQQRLMTHASNLLADADRRVAMAAEMKRMSRPSASTEVAELIHSMIQ